MSEQEQAELIALIAECERRDVDRHSLATYEE